MVNRMCCSCGMLQHQTNLLCEMLLIKRQNICTLHKNKGNNVLKNESISGFIVELFIIQLTHRQINSNGSIYMFILRNKNLKLVSKDVKFFY